MSSRGWNQPEATLGGTRVSPRSDSTQESLADQPKLKPWVGSEVLKDARVIYAA
jgi:hypothetical protein